MFQVGKYIISSDLLEKKFACDLPLCLGNCCRYGDAGAPLSEGEVVILEKIRTKIFPYMREEGRRVVATQGTSVIDIEGESVTPLIDNKECAYTRMEYLNVPLRKHGRKVRLISGSLYLVTFFQYE